MKEQLLILFTTPLYFIVIGIEILLSHLHLKKYYTLKDTLINIYLCLVNGAIDIIFRAVYVVVLFWFYTFLFVDFSFNHFLYCFLILVLYVIIFYIVYLIVHYCCF